MSLPFSDTSTYKGLVQTYERELNLERAFISGNTNRLKDFTAEVNLAWDKYLELALAASGTWQFDDSNHTDYPIIYTNLVSGQRDYTFTTDEQSNLILDIYRVAILPSATDTLYEDVYPVDAQSDLDVYDLVAENTETGTPYRYDKTANGIFLDPAPGYNATSGLKVYINREPSYFIYTDTTKKPGCPGGHHRYFVIRPAFEYARRHSLANMQSLYNEVIRLEDEIVRYFNRRERDKKAIITSDQINHH